MTLAPTQTEKLARARGDLRLGLPIVLAGGGHAIIAAAVETLSSDRLRALRGLGPLVLALTARRAETLKARAYDGDVARIAVPQSPVRVDDVHFGWLSRINLGDGFGVRFPNIFKPKLMKN